MNTSSDNKDFRKKKLKELILKLHEGVSEEDVKQELASVLSRVPYGDVVEVEQELINEGLPESEVLRLCDIHGGVLEGHIDLSNMKEIPEGHPVDVFKKENEEILKVVGKTYAALDKLAQPGGGDFKEQRLELLGYFNELSDVDKHYQRKEYLLFPFLEQRDITGPPKVMWGKHDEIREQLKGCIEILRTESIVRQDIVDSMELLFRPCVRAVRDMVQKEEEILLPMALDELTTDDWWEISQQTLDFGFTLYDPPVEWKPEGMEKGEDKEQTFYAEGNIKLPSGSFTSAELKAMLNTVPFDMTFVDRNDRVKYFTQGKHRIFPRSRSIINRDVRLCHPPGSVDIVEKILEDFKSGKASHAPFWIQMKGRFIYIEYYALRDEKGEYAGTLEVSQDLTELRELSGE
ncbi:MAG: DUF438 domain-containing protein, partial [Bacteroidales bacterium]